MHEIPKANMSIKESLDTVNVPSHVAVIMDGNGRWAKQQGELRTFGHHHGVSSVREVVEGCVEVGVKYLTIYAFSTENWNRPEIEVMALMEILVASLKNETPLLNKNGIRLNAIGDIDKLPPTCRATLEEALHETSTNSNMTLNIALSYSGRWDIVNAVKSIVGDIKEGKMEVDEINDTLFSSYLSTAGMPDPELMIRTSGEMRISNYLLWQLAYTELYITSKLWPDFKKEDFFEAIRSYQNRERRFGKTGDQI